ncbi:MAG: AI-2E family transporter [Candidatus Moranbacteria bacterium]|nr:AI-2E family transporter [Candidatus Moranbacteria bacterium]
MANETKQIEISTSTIVKIVLAGLLLWLLFLTREILMLLFVAIIVVSALEPLIGKLEEKKMPRVLGAALVYFAFIVLLVTAIYIIMPILSKEAKQLADNIPSYFEGTGNFVNNLNALAVNYNFESNLQSFIDNTSNRMADLASAAFSNTVSFFAGFLKVVIVLSLSFYLLVKKDGIRGFLSFVVPEKHRHYAVKLTAKIQNKMGRWLIGQLSLALVVFILDFLVLSFLGVPYALLLALIGGFLEIIPYIGPVLAFIPAVLVALLVSPLIALLVALFYILIQQLENHVLTPLIMKKAVGLDPVVIILALLIGGTLAGFLGVLIAVPFATAVNVVFEDFHKFSSQKA